MTDQMYSGGQPHHPENTRLIPLTQGKHAIVDAADYAWLNQWKWFAHCESGHWYALRAQDKKMIRMHRFVMASPAAMLVDHIDGNGLNNCRSNLRLATKSQNACNRRAARKDSRSGLIGVRPTTSGKWFGVVKVKGRIVCTGVFSSKEDAAIARDEIALRLHGEYASSNFGQKGRM